MVVSLNLNDGIGLSLDLKDVGRRHLWALTWGVLWIWLQERGLEVPERRTPRLVSWMENSLSPRLESICEVFRRRYLTTDAIPKEQSLLIGAVVLSFVNL